MQLFDLEKTLAEIAKSFPEGINIIRGPITNGMRMLLCAECCTYNLGAYNDTPGYEITPAPPPNYGPPPEAPGDIDDPGEDNPDPESTPLERRPSIA